MTNPARRLATGWNRFFFEPQETSTLALVRIAFGLVVLGWTVSLLPDLFVFYGPDGIVPAQPAQPPGTWGLLSVLDSTPAVAVLWLGLLLAAGALTVGAESRVAAVVVFVLVLSFERRNPMIVNGGDVLLRMVALLLALAPCGESLSVDRWRRDRDRFWEFPARAPWALRLIQILVSVIYLSSLWSKVQGQRWREGSAVSFAMRIQDIHRFPVPSFVTDSVALTELATFATMGLELSLAILVWNRTARPWVLALGVVMHLLIAFSVMVGFFTLMMLCVYLAFVPAETASRLVLAARDRFLARRERSAREPVDDGSPHTATES